MDTLSGSRSLTGIAGSERGERLAELIDALFRLEILSDVAGVRSARAQLFAEFSSAQIVGAAAMTTRFCMGLLGNVEFRSRRTPAGLAQLCRDIADVMWETADRRTTADAAFDLTFALSGPTTEVASLGEIDWDMTVLTGHMLNLASALVFLVADRLDLDYGSLFAGAISLTWLPYGSDPSSVASLGEVDQVLSSPRFAETFELVRDTLVASASRVRGAARAA